MQARQGVRQLLVPDGFAGVRIYGYEEPCPQ